MRYFVRVKHHKHKQKQNNSIKINIIHDQTILEKMI